MFKNRVRFVIVITERMERTVTVEGFIKLPKKYKGKLDWI